jgi:hypothetical protein
MILYLAAKVQWINSKVERQKAKFIVSPDHLQIQN